jgi:hypothetical protein
MTRIASDSMPAPQGGEDFTLEYEEYHGIPSHCCIRVYRPEGAPPVIVATEAYDVEELRHVDHEPRGAGPPARLVACRRAVACGVCRALCGGD